MKPLGSVERMAAAWAEHRAGAVRFTLAEVVLWLEGFEFPPVYEVNKVSARELASAMIYHGRQAALWQRVEGNVYEFVEVTT